MTTATCESCGDEFSVNRINPNQRRWYCFKSECRKAYAQARNRDLVESDKLKRVRAFCVSCGDVIRVDGRYCKRPACRKARRRETYLASKQKVRVWSAFNEAVVKEQYGVWVNARAMNSCSSCRFYDHCQQRVRYGIPVSCESWSERDKELLQINPAYDKIQLLLVEGMAL